MKLEGFMETAIERIMQTYGMIQNLSVVEEQQIRLDVAAFLSKQAETGQDEHRLTISGLKYLRQRYS